MRYHIEVMVSVTAVERVVNICGMRVNEMHIRVLIQLKRILLGRHNTNGCFNYC